MDYKFLAIVKKTKRMDNYHGSIKAMGIRVLSAPAVKGGLYGTYEIWAGTSDILVNKKNSQSSVNNKGLTERLQI